MLALGAAVALVLLVTWRPADSKPNYTPVDAHAVAISASDLSFTPLELDLGKGWNATTAWVESVPSDITKSHWHVSYVKGTSKYVAIDQSDTSVVTSFVDGFITSEIGSENVGGVIWQTYAGESEDVVAVRVQENLVTLITANSYPLLLEALSKLS